MIAILRDGMSENLQNVRSVKMKADKVDFRWTINKSKIANRLLLRSTM